MRAFAWRKGPLRPRSIDVQDDRVEWLRAGQKESVLAGVSNDHGIGFPFEAFSNCLATFRTSSTTRIRKHFLFLYTPAQGPHGLRFS